MDGHNRSLVNKEWVLESFSRNINISYLFLFSLNTNTKYR